MLLVNFFQAKSIGLALLPVITILHSGQVALADGRKVNCMPHFDSDDSKPDVGKT
jgi:hypothetical protein